MFKVLLFIFLYNLSLLEVTSNDNLNSLWSQHKKDFDLKFNKKEDEKRKEIFKNNLDFIEQHNKKPSSFKLGMNLFGHMTYEEYLQTLQKGIHTNKFRSLKSNLPDKNSRKYEDVDWRKKGAVTDVQNQGQCGSCWAFGAIAGLEGQLAIKYNKLLKLSEQELVDCSGIYGNGGCRGGAISLALLYVKNYGISNSSYYPYTAKDGKCRYSNSTVTLKISNFVFLQDHDENKLTNFINNIGPISIGYDARDPNFQYYRSGVFVSDRCSSSYLTHAMAAVGVGSDPSSYYIVKNSWGKSWGDNGYILTARNKGNMCGIASYYLYPIL